MRRFNVVIALFGIYLCSQKHGISFAQEDGECVIERIVDFSETAEGTMLSNGDKIDDSIQFEGGVIIQAQSTYHRDKDDLYNDALIVDAELYDSDNKEDDDGSGGDLNQPQQGNVLVVTKKAKKFDEPDDAKRGGEILIEFQEPVTVISIKVLDSDSFGNRIRLYDADGERLDKINVPKGDHGGLEMVDLLSTRNVTVMQIFIKKFSAIDDIVFLQPCPPTNVPSVVPTVEASDFPSEVPSLLPSAIPTYSPNQDIAVTQASLVPTVCTNDYIIDFSSTGQGMRLESGYRIDDSVSFGGGVATFQARRTRKNGNNNAPYRDAMIYASTDEAAKTGGNVLVISDNNDMISNRGGVILAQFTQAVTVVSLKIVETKGFGGKIEFYGEDGAELEELAIPRLGNDESMTLLPAVNDVWSMKVTLKKAGALDDIEIWRDCTFEPSVAPSLYPSDVPSSLPSEGPSTSPSESPTEELSEYPSEVPSGLPSYEPSEGPTLPIPTVEPTSAEPSAVPSVCVEDMVVDFTRTQKGAKKLRASDRIYSNVPFWDGAVTFSAQKKQGSSKDSRGNGDWTDAVIIDTTNPPEKDEDFYHESLGNVLSIAASMNEDEPVRVSQKGGWIMAEFAHLVHMVSITVLDTDDFGSEIEFYDDEDNLFDTMSIPRIDDGASQTLELDMGGVKKLVVFFNKSGAIDNVAFQRDCLLEMASRRTT